MKKLYTDPCAELITLHTSDLVTSSSTIIELDDTRRDTFVGAGAGFESVF